MSIAKDIPDLIKAGIISQETADRILAYYNNKAGKSTNKLFIVFGILGAMLIGLGIILIIAHNWDDLPHTIKLSFAFLPLVVGQLICGYVLIKRVESTAWRESSAAFLFFAVASSISLVSQIYHISGNLALFILTWMLLCLPLIYVLRSSIVSLLYLIGITTYACEVSYWNHPVSESYLFWLLLSAAIPHYYLLIRYNPQSNFLHFHNWIIPLSMIIVLGTVAYKTDDLMFIAYFSLFGLFSLIGDIPYFKVQSNGNNAYSTYGQFGTIVLLLTLSFDWFWEDLRTDLLQYNDVIFSPEFFTSIIISLAALALLVIKIKNKKIISIVITDLIFIIFIIIFIVGATAIGAASPIPVILINLLVLAIGILTIRTGAKQDHLGLLNYGLLVITALVTCRFFDTDLSFVTRGLLFISVGAGFFAANYRMLKKRKSNE